MTSTEYYDSELYLLECSSRCDIPEEPEDDDEALRQPTYTKTFKKQQWVTLGFICRSL